MDRPSYAAHEVLVGPARPFRQLWRLVIGVVVIGLVAFGLNSALHAVLFALAPEFWIAWFATAEVMGNSAVPLLILLFSFGFVAAGVAVAAWLVQRRPPMSVIGPFPVFLSQFWRVFRLLFLISLVLAVLPPYDMGGELVPNLDFALWLKLLPLSLLAVLVQTGAEEILFRGYFQQALAARFKSPLVWMILPAVLFAVGHYLPAEAGDNAVLIAAWAGVFGILTADLTARAGTLGPAIAVHFANNVVAILFLSLPDGLSGLSLYTLPFEMSDGEALRGWLVIDFTMMLVSWLAARVAIRR